MNEIIIIKHLLVYGLFPCYIQQNAVAAFKNCSYRSYTKQLKKKMITITQNNPNPLSNCIYLSREQKNSRKGCLEYDLQYTVQSSASEGQMLLVRASDCASMGKEKCSLGRDEVYLWLYPLQKSFTAACRIALTQMLRACIKSRGHEQGNQLDYFGSPLDNII